VAAQHLELQRRLVTLDRSGLIAAPARVHRGPALGPERGQPQGDAAGVLDQPGRQRHHPVLAAERQVEPAGDPGAR
jgi:hypothetical protein